MMKKITFFFIGLGMLLVSCVTSPKMYVETETVTVVEITPSITSSAMITASPDLQTISTTASPSPDTNINTASTSEPVPTLSTITENSFKASKLEAFRDNPLTVADLAKGTEGDYYRWYQQYVAKPFPPGTKPLPLVSIFGMLLPDQSSAPHFASAVDAPVRWKQTAGVVEETGNYQWAVIPIELPNPKDPNHNVLVWGLAPTYYDWKGIHVASTADAENIVGGYKEFIMPPIVDGNNYLAYSIEDPLISELWALDPQMPQHIKDFMAGDPTGMDGKVVLLDNQSWSDMSIFNK